MKSKISNELMMRRFTTCADSQGTANVDLSKLTDMEVLKLKCYWFQKIGKYIVHKSMIGGVEPIDRLEDDLIAKATKWGVIFENEYRRRLGNDMGHNN